MLQSYFTCHSSEILSAFWLSHWQPTILSPAVSCLSWILTLRTLMYHWSMVVQEKYTFKLTLTQTWSWFIFKSKLHCRPEILTGRYVWVFAYNVVLKHIAIILHMLINLIYHSFLCMHLYQSIVICKECIELISTSWQSWIIAGFSNTHHVQPAPDLSTSIFG